MCVFRNESLFPSYAATFIIPKTYYFVENRTETKYSSQTISKVTICGKIILFWTFHGNEADSANFTGHSINIHNSGQGVANSQFSLVSLFLLLAYEPPSPNCRVSFPIHASHPKNPLFQRILSRPFSRVLTYIYCLSFSLPIHQSLLPLFLSFSLSPGRYTTEPSRELLPTSSYLILETPEFSILSTQNSIFVTLHKDI